MNRSTHSFLRCATPLLALAIAVGGAAAAQPPHTMPGPAKTDANTVLLAAASPFEDMTEFSLDGNAAGVERASKAYASQSAQVDAALSSAQRARLHTRLAAIAKARTTADHSAVALNAVEAYGILVEALRPEKMKVPVEVQRLDYAGFKLKVLMHGNAKDWPAARTLSTKARADWSAIKPRITDKGLQDAMDVVTRGMQQSTDSSNAGMASLAADVDLALVDLLETYFEAIPAK